MSRAAAALVVALAGSAVAAAGCGGAYPGTTLGQQVGSWVRTTGFSSSLRSLRADAQRVPRLEAEHSPAALRTGCDVLVNDALGANQNLPTPDTVLTGILAGAYRSAAAAGRDCLAVADGRGALLARCTAELGRAASGYVRAEARLDDLGAPGTPGAP